MKAPYEFWAIIQIIGINPYVSVPDEILESIFDDAGKDKGPIPIAGTVNTKPYVQTLVKYAGLWRLYINTVMLENSPKRIGEKIRITVAFDPKERLIAMHPLLKKALDTDAAAKSVFEQLPPSRRKEIVRYISFLKSEETVKANVIKAIDFLVNDGVFAGRKL